jgi:hypothetical protein
MRRTRWTRRELLDAQDVLAAQDALMVVDGFDRRE